MKDNPIIINWKLDIIIPMRIKLIPLVSMIAAFLVHKLGTSLCFVGTPVFDFLHDSYQLIGFVSPIIENKISQDLVINHFL